ncbi:MAG: substrate-binding domain-containing protein [Nostoc sp. NMS7]|uniref:substrate-binding domain-containing protein n=1 Tax=Nostoc sp. NMS7 TaxID=2815391 RepID=UPI0025F56BE0|nr:substrate-binding domain-containing protein [Nostoc sp. NMS7]MBN3950957.1 substrate-binding domain-containing protein [Nostoc sp. NMS7]
MKRIGLIVGILGFAVVSCTNGAQNDNTATNTTNTATNTSAETKIATENKKLRAVGFTVGDLSNPFFVVMGQAVEAEAKRIGGKDVTVIVASSAYDLNQQANQIENFTAANADIIVLNAADKRGIRPIVENAKRAGRIIIALNSINESLNSINESLNSINEFLNSVNESLNSVNESLVSTLLPPLPIQFG